MSIDKISFVCYLEINIKEKIIMSKSKQPTIIKKMGIKGAENSKYEKINGVWHLVLENGKKFPIGENKEQSKVADGKIEDLFTR